MSDNNIFIINEDIQFSTVMQWRQQAEHFISDSASTAIRMDFSNAKWRDTAGLALITSILRFAKAQGKSVEFVLSDSVKRILDVCGLLQLGIING